jgi:hypothetical protein
MRRRDFITPLVDRKDRGKRESRVVTLVAPCANQRLPTGSQFVHPPSYHLWIRLPKPSRLNIVKRFPAITAVGDETIAL